MLTPAQPGDTPTLMRLLSLAFATPPDKVQEWLANSGVENFRLYKDGGDTLACCLRLPMGHYFGGSAVRSLGVAGVAVAPEARGRGIATRMMKALLHEARAEGVSISSLYPATLPLYRRVGYEQAGSWFEYRLGLTHLRLDGTIREGARLGVRAYEPARDLDGIKACYRACAALMSGHLERSDYIWGRIFHPRAGPAMGFVCGRESAGGAPGEVEGYVFLRQERLPSNRHDVHLTDIAAATPGAAQRIIAFLRDFQSTGEDVVWHGGPVHPLTTLLLEQKFRVQFKEFWMLRIVDVARALTARGYNPHVTARFALRITDDVFAENVGCWEVVVRDGGASVTAAKETAGDVITADIRALAAMYTGFLTPGQLAALGRVQGGRGALAAAEAAFAGPPPSLPDMF